MGEHDRRMDAQTRREMNLHWLAGFFEGEGSTYASHRHGLSMMIGNTNVAVLRRIQKIYPPFKLHGPYHNGFYKNGDKKWISSIAVHGENAGFLACLLGPLLSSQKTIQLNRAWNAWRPYVQFGRAICHPTRPSYARGLCGSCYQRAWQLRHRVS